MNKRDLKKLIKSELIELLFKLQKKLANKKPQIVIVDNTEKPISESLMRKPIPTPRKSIKDMVRNYEENTILHHPSNFRMITNLKNQFQF